jgi:hypothetical protein
MWERLEQIRRSFAASSGGYRRAAIISAACGGATLPEPRLTPKEFRRCTRRGSRSATTTTIPREASSIAPALRRFLLELVLLTSLLKLPINAQILSLPPRPAAAPTASQLRTNTSFLTTNLVERENFIHTQILTGNVPDFLRRLTPVTLTGLGAGGTNIVTIYVTPTYLALGSDTDFVLMPMTPGTAQRIADATDSILPTRKIVDAIYASATVKLPPQPLRPDARMTTVPVFLEHNEIVRTQRLAATSSPNALIAGHKKDVVVSPRLTTATNKVAIYGWHRTNSVAIQPLYLGHTSAWVDYSHGIRLVSQTVLLNGQRTNITALLAQPELCHLLSDEGVLMQARYPVIPDAIPLSSGKPVELGWPIGFKMSGTSDELTGEFHLTNEVRIIINTPPFKSFTTNKPVLLIFYALPNGNSIEWTIGKKLQPGDDWHFNIQHIGAQTRFLRNVLTNQTVVVAYLENSLKSWPAWRRQHGDGGIPGILNSVRSIFADYPQAIVLTGHSGGGSLTFGYLNAVPEIPRDIKRIAFLDSNYAYETTNHFAMLVKWLKQSDDPLTPSLSPSDGERVAARTGERSANHLSVLAYHDSIALLDGKTFVSERGGTWGRSHAMLSDFQRAFSFTSRTNGAGLQSHLAADGRIQFFLKENPDRRILHTLQVDRNGFIHAMLTGTPLENHGYEYFGARAYEQWISAD